MDPAWKHHDQMFHNYPSQPGGIDTSDFFDFDAWVQPGCHAFHYQPGSEIEFDIGSTEYRPQAQSPNLNSTSETTFAEKGIWNQSEFNEYVHALYTDPFLVDPGSPQINLGSTEGMPVLVTTEVPETTASLGFQDRQNDGSADRLLNEKNDTPIRNISAENVAPTEINIPLAQKKNLEPHASTSLVPTKRTRLSKQAKAALQKHFRVNAYPNDAEVQSLSKATKLTGRTIKTWFTNTRSRVKSINYTNNEMHEGPISTNCSHSPVVVTFVSRASLDALDKVSPNGSTSSLQRWLETPAIEDAFVPGGLLPEQPPTHPLPSREHSMNMDGIDATPLVVRREPSWPVTPNNLTVKHKASSVADSLGSRGTGSSYGSQTSFKSVDSRGPRRGRKMWKRSHSRTGSHRSSSEAVVIRKSSRAVMKARAAADTLDSSATDSVHCPDQSPNDTASTRESSGGNASRRYLCTFSDCTARFKFPFEWVRHEEALHYQPYHWICCLEDKRQSPERFPKCWVCGQFNVTANHFVEQHFGCCIEKDQGDRTFLREDQLLQHINGVHLKTRVSKITTLQLLHLWKIENPRFDRNSLTCGFCGNLGDTWSARHKHVSEHFRQGAICKSAWWPGRLPSVEPRMVYTSTGIPFPCPGCGYTSKDSQTASQEHPCCSSWSCRNLLDTHATFYRTSFEFVSLHVYQCRLCDFNIIHDSPNPQPLLTRVQEHVESHELRSCNQEVFYGEEDFDQHLRAVHGATKCPQRDLRPWKLSLDLNWKHGALALSKSRPFSESELICKGCNGPHHKPLPRGMLLKDMKA